uniref:Uncharacterized protein n=1 Tax=Oryza brachyantha TaxID=4533 RepID=J3N9Q4_ORYBR
QHGQTAGRRAPPPPPRSPLRRPRTGFLLTPPALISRELPSFILTGEHPSTSSAGRSPPPVAPSSPRRPPLPLAILRP